MATKLALISTSTSKTPTIIVTSSATSRLGTLKNPLATIALVSTTTSHAKPPSSLAQQSSSAGMVPAARFNTGGQPQLIIAIVMPIVGLLVSFVALASWYYWRRWKRSHPGRRLFWGNDTPDKGLNAKIQEYLARGLEVDAKCVLTPSAIRARCTYHFRSQNDLASTSNVNTKSPDNHNHSRKDFSNFSETVQIKLGYEVPVRSRWISTPVEAIKKPWESFRKSFVGDIRDVNHSDRGSSEGSLSTGKSSVPPTSSPSQLFREVTIPINLRVFKLARSRGGANREPKGFEATQPKPLVDGLPEISPVTGLSPSDLNIPLIGGTILPQVLTLVQADKHSP
ncbi:hypothetical protein BABINDRAFT_175655 [Babjeviella inositovora NRRL Y-12698]|uniref:Uncharacterized protein n=1 Tax=Babjeviella inositovora NRRL Y-12698 TaxID=984486 RepID=A0A1E3QTH9_9ASCO|nr:uncharacterized protein BABINDRAFT_175655 [Babjeviella inositovora NRRL Y-12698]ODQ80237.1 hypothetical protein BABINDRAFT_175655 [Babjeviella inositovora NRRL Y-12698]